MDATTRHEIEARCRALSHAFSYHLDQKNYTALAELFAPDGVFVRTGVRLEGRAKILEVMSQRSPEQFTRHVTTNMHFIEVGADVAKAVSYNLSFFGAPESALPLDYAPQNLMLLDFIDTFVRTPGGWRFQERDARPLLIPAELRPLIPAAGQAAPAGH